MDKTKRMGGTRTYVTVKSVKLDPNSKAYKKAIARSKGMLTGNPDIYQTTGKFVDKKAKQGLTSCQQYGIIKI